MKKIIVLCLVIISVFLFGCNSESNKQYEDTISEITNSNHTEYKSDNYYATPETTNYVRTDYAEKNEDGVYDFLKKTDVWYNYDVESFTGSLMDYCYLSGKEYKFFLSKKSNPTIEKYKRSEVFGVYYNTDTIKLIPITEEFRYTPNLSFCYSGTATTLDKFDVSKAPDSITYPRGSQFNFHDSDEIEVNGVDYYEFIDKNTVKFDVKGLYENYILIDAQKGDTFTFGGYKGTAWTTYDFVADFPFCVMETYNEISFDVQKTRNGYFTVDFSSVTPGLYYVYGYDNVIEICE